MYKAPPSQPSARSGWFFRPPNRWGVLGFLFPTLVWGWRFISDGNALWAVVALIWGMLALADALPARFMRLSGWLRINVLLACAGMLAWIVITNL
jgi:hypothetical protein